MTQRLVGSRRSLSRRDVLRGAGVALALPWLDAMRPAWAADDSKFRPWAKSIATQPRMVCCYIEGSMLDQTIALFGSGMNSGAGGDHSPNNLPLLLAGGSRLGLNHGQHLAFDEQKHPPLSNVLLSMAQAMGIETDRFADATGTLTGLSG
jgi:hypothetical protein